MSLPARPPSRPPTLVRLAAAFGQWLLVRGYSQETLRTWTKHVRPFVAWSARVGVTKAQYVTRTHLRRHEAEQRLRRTREGRPLAPASHNTRVTALRRFLRWLADEGFVRDDPARELVRTRQGRRLPPGVLTHDDAEAVLRAPRVGTALGLRDRTILETLYSTGLRRAELAALEVRDVDPARRVILVRSGKGRRDRVVPVGERALAWISRHLARSRVRLRSSGPAAPVFATRTGRPLATTTLSHLVRSYVRRAGIGKPGACHAFRHAMATVMLENGADLRVIQEILGHANLGTTQLYTHVAIGRIQEVHAATHPAARLARPRAPRRVNPGRSRTR